MSEKLYIWTDGACQPNPGAGGWAALMEYKGTRKLISGRTSEQTTNNRMEIQAAIEAFKAIKAGWICDVLVTSDSQYLVNTMDGDWQMKSNIDLFLELSELVKPHTVTWKWVKGHAGIVENEIVNTKAEAEARFAQREAQWVTE
jgi:ribonuclease HI